MPVLSCSAQIGILVKDGGRNIDRAAEWIFRKAGTHRLHAARYMAHDQDAIASPYYGGSNVIAEVGVIVSSV